MKCWTSLLHSTTCPERQFLAPRVGFAVRRGGGEESLSPNVYGTCPSGQLASGGLALTHCTLDLGCETLCRDLSVEGTATIKDRGGRSGFPAKRNQQELKCKRNTLRGGFTEAINPSNCFARCYGAVPAVNGALCWHLACLILPVP